MNPYERTRDLYAQHPERVLERDLWLHLQHGYVISTPRLFAMVRSVNRHWNPGQLNDIALADPDGDAWLVWVACGDASELRNILTPKKWLGYARRGVLRWVNYDRARRIYLARTPRPA